jgi:hypothetical protein
MNGVNVLAVLPPGYRLWALILEIRVGGLHLVTKLVTVCERCTAVPAGELVCFVRQTRVIWQDLDLVQGLPRSVRHHGEVARDLIAEQVSQGFDRGPLVADDL